MTKEELLAEEHICNGKCQDDITKNYVHCKTCTRLKDFLAGYKVRKEELEAQIEKMKCGQNCKHSYLYQEDRKCKFTYCDCINCKDKWELRR